MPRSGAGVYTVPAGINPVITGTVIQDTWANPTLTDVAQGITDSLDRSGRGDMLAALKLFSGTQALPGISFAAEPSSGLYRVSAGVLGVSILNADIARFASGIALALGSNSLPAYSFLGDLNTGMWSPGADILAWSTGGAERARLDAAGHFLPGATTSYDLGSTASRWNSLFSVAADFNGLVTFGGATPPVVNTANGVAARYVMVQQSQRQWSIGLPVSGQNWTLRDDSGGSDKISVATSGDVTFSGALSGITSLAIGGAFTGATTGAFSGAVLMAGLTASTGAFSGAVTASDLDLTNNVVAGGGFNSDNVTFGTYTPTLFNVGNIDSSTAYLCHWMRVGNEVHVSGAVDIDPTAAAGTLLGISLPVASALTAAEQLIGTSMRASAAVANPGWILADAANDRATLTFVAGYTSPALTHVFNFSYRVL